MGKHRRKEKIQQKDSKPAHITGTMTVFEYVHELLAGECSLGCGCTCFFANVHNLFHHTSAMDLKDLVTFTSEGDSQLKNSHESLTKCSDRQHKVGSN